MQGGPILLLVICIFSVAQSQARHGQAGSSASGTLTVTATVESSVFAMMEPDGKQELVVANSPDSKESFAHDPPTKAGRKGAIRAKKQTFSAIARELPRRQDDAAVQFRFPTVSKEFEVTKKQVMMEVSEGGKTERRPVTVTTIVAP